LVPVIQSEIFRDFCSANSSCSQLIHSPQVCPPRHQTSTGAADPFGASAVWPSASAVARHWSLTWDVTLKKIQVGGDTYVTFWIHHQNLAIYYPSIIIYSWFPVPKIHTLPGLEDYFPLKIWTMFRVELLIEAAGYSQ
jgi:hypothetical protein